MYSILIKSSSNNYSYAFGKGSDEVFSGNLEETKVRFMELLQTYPISKLVIVHNTTVDSNMVIVDVE